VRNLLDIAISFEEDRAALHAVSKKEFALLTPTASVQMHK
jgi:hypothetical protein